MKARLVQSIISTVLEEAAIVIVVLWGLPQMGVGIPLWGLILIMIAWAAYSTFTHRLGTRALLREQLPGLTDMVGCEGSVVRTLKPEGLVRIKGELWVATSEGGELEEGKPVTVVGQKRLKLIVMECGSKFKVKNPNAKSMSND